MAARPLASVLTPSTGCTIEPVLASAKSPPLWATEVVGRNTVRVATALVEAAAAELSQIAAPTASSTMISSPTIHLRPPRRLGAGLTATARRAVKGSVLDGRSRPQGGST